MQRWLDETYGVDAGRFSVENACVDATLLPSRRVRALLLLSRDWLLEPAWPTSLQAHEGERLAVGDNRACRSVAREAVSRGPLAEAYHAVHLRNPKRIGWPW